MVLLFIKPVSGKEFGLNIKLSSTVDDLKYQISKYIEISSQNQRLIFRGKILKDNELLTKYNLSKECKVQLYKINKNNIINNNNNNNIQHKQNNNININKSKYSKFRTEIDPSYTDNISPFLDFGDIVLIHLIEGRDLKKSGFWTGLSNPYVTIGLSSYQCKSKVIKRNLNPQWNEMFCFVIDRPRNSYISQNNCKNNSNKKIRNSAPTLNINNKKSLFSRVKSKSFTNDWSNNNTNNDSLIDILHNTSEDNSDVLSFMVFDKEKFTPDDFLGSASIKLNHLPFDTVVDLWIPLEHVDTGHIHVKLRRCSLPSPMHRNISIRLMENETNITIKDLQKYNITLDQIVGQEAWICNDMSNPAIEHLVQVILNKKIDYTHGTLKRIQSILRSQHMLPTSGLPTRYIWFSGLCFNNNNNNDNNNNNNNNITTKKSFLNAIEQYVTPKRCFLPKGNYRLSFAMLEFKSIRDSLLIYIMFQHKKVQDRRMLLGFGRRIDLIGEFLQNTKQSGYLNIYDIEKKEWKLCWCFLSNKILYCFNDLQNENPISSIDVSNAVICSRGPSSVEIFDKNTKSSCFAYSHSKEEMKIWIEHFDEMNESNENENNQTNEEMKSDVCNNVDDDIFVECDRCNNSVLVVSMYCPDPQVSPSCTNCLRKDILIHLSDKNITYLIKNYSIQDLRELLNNLEFNEYLELSLLNLLENDTSFVKCPKCLSNFEFITGNTIQNIKNNNIDFKKMYGINNKLLNKISQLHYLNYRICCISCGTNFCKSCNEIPYHSGFDCEYFLLYKNAEKCRFCNIALLPDVIANISDNLIQNVCNNEICLEKRELSCNKIHTCSHVCMGIKDEVACLPCIMMDCKNKPLYVLQQCNDYCNICYDKLSSSPCIKLDCRHIFHYDCIIKKLKDKPEGPRISFGYVKCPLCNIKISCINNNTICKELESIQLLHKEIEKRCYFQLKEDKIINDKGIINYKQFDDVNNIFCNNPIGYGMNRYAYYNCFVCNKAYYGGLLRCLDSMEYINKSDFICPACSGIGLDSCSIHGRDYMIYKCKFCCSVASYFCWGNTHFCPKCHKRQENHDYMTTKPKDKLVKCPGVDKCPLGIDHPPNGEEFSLGCSLCRGAESFNNGHLHNNNIIQQQQFQEEEKEEKEEKKE